MFVWMVAAFVLFLGPLAFLHELGHFWAAKRCGISVEEFGFGLGPRLATLFVRDGTRYTIRAIPFAAFVRLAGEEESSTASGLMNAPRATRLVVAAAGPVINIAAALILFWVAYLFGPPAFTRVVLSDVVPDSPAAVAGLLIGDVILELDGIAVASTAQVADYTHLHLGQPIALLVERDGRSLEVNVTPREKGEYDPEVDGPMGIGMYLAEAGPARSQGLFEAGRSAVSEFVQVLEATVQWPGKLIHAFQVRSQMGDSTALVSPDEDLRYFRPVGIYGILQLIAITLETGFLKGYWIYVFRTAGLISIALGVTNLLPLPALDGGRILFVVLDWLSEKILRRKINPEKEILVHGIGIMVLVLLMVVITWQDIVNPLIQFSPSSTPTP